MREQWLTSSLSEVIVKTGTIDPRKEPDKKIHYVDVSGISRTKLEITEPTELLGKDAPSRARRLIKKGDVLFATVRPTLKRAAIVPESLDGEVCSTGYFVFRTKPEIENRFLFYYLISDDFMGEMEKIQSGASYPAVNDAQVKQQLISYPSIEEQKRIVAILDEAFAGIDTAIANTEKNLANARELFESYLNSIFMQKDKGWDEIKLEELTIKITKGSSPKWQGVNYVEKPGILFVTSENVDTNKMNYKKTKFVEEVFNEKDSKSILKRGDVLTNIVGASIGRTAVFDRDDVANINQAVCLIRCDKDKLINTYLSYLLNSPYFKQILHDNEIDNARANLSLGFFRSLTIPVPEIIEQEQLISEINALSVETRRLESIYKQKLASLIELKQSLLQKAFSGELTAEGDKLMDEAVA